MDAETTRNEDYGPDYSHLPTPSEASAWAEKLLLDAVSDVTHSDKGREAFHVAWHYEGRAVALCGLIYSMRKHGHSGPDVDQAEGFIRVALEYLREIKETGGEHDPQA